MFQVLLARTRNRQQRQSSRRRQRKALKEAVAAGWNVYDSEDENDQDYDSNSGEEEEDRGHGGSIPPKKQEDTQQEAALIGAAPHRSSTSQTEEKQQGGGGSSSSSSRRGKAAEIQVKSFSNFQVFSPDYFNDLKSSSNDDDDDDEEESSSHEGDGERGAAAGPPKQTYTSGSSCCDDDDDDEEEDDNDDDEEEALDDKPELQALIQELCVAPPTMGPSAVIATATTVAGSSSSTRSFQALEEAAPRKNGPSLFKPQYEEEPSTSTTATEEPSSESTLEITESSSSGHSSGNNNERILQKGEAESSGDDDDDYDSDNDDDSLDFEGVQSSIWPEQRRSNTASAASAAPPLSSFSLPGISPMMTDRNNGSNNNGSFVIHESPLEEHEDEVLAVDGDDADEDVAGEKHEGADVFLATEGTRYAPGHAHNNSCSITDLFAENDDDDDGDDDGRNPNPAFRATPASPDPLVRNHLLQRGLINTFDDDQLSNKATAPSPSGKNNRVMVHGSDAADDDDTDERMWEALKTASSQQDEPEKPSLSSMIHSIDRELLLESSPSLLAVKKMPLDSSFSSADGGSSVASCPVQRSPVSILKSDQYTIMDAKPSKSRRSHLSSSFRSSTKGTNRVSYTLGQGKKAMSQSQKIYSKSYLPNRPVLLSKSDDAVSVASSSSSKSPLTRMSTNDRCLSLLLVEMSQKVFEVVSIDMHHDTTVGDVLAKARVSATDPALSEQKYMSICYGGQEFAAPMLPLRVVIDWTNHAKPLAVAVPLGSTAREMSLVKRVLWKNPKTKRWWSQDDPFSPRVKKKASSVGSDTTTKEKKSGAMADAGVEVPDDTSERVNL